MEKGDMMALPKHTISGRKAWKEWIERHAREIQTESYANPEIHPDWLPMYIELMDYTFMLEDRITQMELSEL